MSQLALVIDLNVFDGQPGGRYLWEYTVHNNSYDPQPGMTNGFSGFELFLPSISSWRAKKNCSLPAGVIRVTKMGITRFPPDMSIQGNFRKTPWYVKPRKKSALPLIQRI